MEESPRAPEAASPNPLNKACEPCRALKVRCLPSPDGSTKCQRCVKFERACVYAPPQRKKQRKRTDARVAELEREIKAMRSLLEKAQRQNHANASMASKLGNEHTSPASSDDRSSSTPPGTSLITISDVVDRGMINAAEASRLLDMYRQEFMPHYPLVYIAPDVTVEQLRQEQPLLFHAIMATASSKARPEIYTKLSTEIVQDFVQRILFHGEKSLEIVKAIMITCAWYHPTDRWSTLRFYEYSHLAVTVAIDIGLGERDNVGVPRSEADEAIPRSVLLRERKHTIMACYAQSASTSVSLRRPNMMHFTPYLADLVKEMESSPTATPAGRTLAAFVHVINIGIDISNEFRLSEGSPESTLSADEFKTKLVTFHRRLNTWRQIYRHEALSNDLQMVHHYIRITLYEKPLHQFYPPSLFRPPYFLYGPHSTDFKLDEGACHALTQIAMASHAVLDMFISQPTAGIRSLPCYMYQLATHAALMLILIEMLPTPDIAIPHVNAAGFYNDMAQAEVYLNSLMEKLLEAAGDMEFRVPSLFAGGLWRVQKWFPWVRDRQQRGLKADGDLLVGVFAGPDDHPALRPDEVMDSSPRAASSPGAERSDKRSDTSRVPGESPFTMASPSTPNMDQSQSPPTKGTASTSPQTMSTASPPTSKPGNDYVADMAHPYQQSYPNMNHQSVISPDMFLGTNQVAESYWVDSLQADFSTMLDPNLFDPMTSLAGMTGAFQNLNAFHPSGAIVAPDSIQAFAGMNVGDPVSMYGDLPLPRMQSQQEGDDKS